MSAGGKREKIQRQKMPEQPPEERRRNFKEVPLGYTPALARLEASRCLQCKKPKCVAGCPVGIDIPAFVKLIAEGDFDGAARKIREKNALPAVCGRVCPQEDQCEKVCVLTNKEESVAVGCLERFAADWERNRGELSLPSKLPPTGKKVAIVGSGPAGLTAAGDLVLKGHEVTVFEAFHKAGGVLIYGIPEFRLPKEIVDAEIRYLEKLGVKIVMNALVGRLKTVDELLKEGYDAVFIGVGAGLPVFLNVPGENLAGVYSANEYLTRANLMKAYLFPEYDTPIVRGKNVAVIGGGNVAMDAVRMALRLGAEKAHLIYRRTRAEMPARMEEIHHAEEEGVEFHFLCAPLRFEGNENGAVSRMELIRMELGQPDASGRPQPVPRKGDTLMMETDLVIVAIGAAANPLLTAQTAGLQLNRKGYIVAEEGTGKTTLRGVWAGGDIVTGAATVIQAMGAGRRAADSIHEYLLAGQEAVWTHPVPV